MTYTTGACYFIFIFYTICAVVWWKQGLMPWWYVCLVPLSSAVGLQTGSPSKIMAGPFVLAGLAAFIWADRGISVMKTKRDVRGMEPMVRFFGTPIGGVVYRVIGMAFAGAGIALWFASPEMFASKPHGH